MIAAALLLITSAAACAQVSSPEVLIGRPPAAATRGRVAAAGTDDLQWMFQYAGTGGNGNKSALMLDVRFDTLLHARLRAPQSMWGVGLPLAQVAREFLGDDGAVRSAGNRYVTVDGCVVELCAQKGLLWVDLGTREPLVVFAALRWTENSKGVDEPGAPYNLWLFASREIDPQKLPDALKAAVRAWAQPDGCRARVVQNALVVEPDGVPHAVGALAVGAGPSVCADAEGH